MKWYRYRKFISFILLFLIREKFNHFSRVTFYRSFYPSLNILRLEVWEAFSNLLYILFESPLFDYLPIHSQYAPHGIGVSWSTCTPTERHFAPLSLPPKFKSPLSLTKTDQTAIHTVSSLSSMHFHDLSSTMTPV